MTSLAEGRRWVTTHIDIRSLKGSWPTVADNTSDGRRYKFFISDNVGSVGGRDLGKVGFRPTPPRHYQLWPLRAEPRQPNPVSWEPSRLLHRHIADLLRGFDISASQSSYRPSEILWHQGFTFISFDWSEFDLPGRSEFDAIVRGPIGKISTHHKLTETVTNLSVSVCVSREVRLVESGKLPTLPTSVRSKKISSNFLRNRPMPTPTSRGRVVSC